MYINIDALGRKQFLFLGVRAETISVLGAASGKESPKRHLVCPLIQMLYSAAGCGLNWFSFLPGPPREMR
jgi:hypothetical protein